MEKIFESMYELKHKSRLNGQDFYRIKVLKKNHKQTNKISKDRILLLFSFL